MAALTSSHSKRSILELAAAVLLQSLQSATLEQLVDFLHRLISYPRQVFHTRALGHLFVKLAQLCSHLLVGDRCKGPFFIIEFLGSFELKARELLESVHQQLVVGVAALLGLLNLCRFGLLRRLLLLPLLRPNRLGALPRARRVGHRWSCLKRILCVRPIRGLSRNRGLRSSHGLRGGRCGFAELGALGGLQERFPPPDQVFGALLHLWISVPPEEDIVHLHSHGRFGKVRERHPFHSI
mmetsp:Transcript_76469/g.212398  ORF Transcript_76469/g.212398 Transcript_76469/m.212398 type:complete len:239 (+) Transcript_76469:84-800(+)